MGYTPKCIFLPMCLDVAQAIWEGTHIPSGSGPFSVATGDHQPRDVCLLDIAKALPSYPPPPPPLSFPTPCHSPGGEGGLGDRHLVNPKFSLRLIVLLCG